jgi:hypothetical protein
MARTREFREVINNSEEEYREEFKGKTLVFPPHGSMVLERREAVALLGQYVPFDREKTSGEKPLSWKPANGKRPAEPAPEVELDAPEFVNNATGKKFASKEELDADLKGFEHLVLKEKED